MHSSTLKSIPNIKVPCKNVCINKIIDFTNQFSLSKKEFEYCPIFDFESLKPKLQFDHKKKFCSGKRFIIARKFLSKFGFPAYGVHCNVWSRFKNSTIIHLAKRSYKLDKFPGFYDNLIAGGQPIELSIEQNFYKEAFEEAGLNQKQVSRAKKSSTVHYQHNEKTNFNSAIIFNYHLEKCVDMKFSNQDGEVDSFFSIELANLYKILETNSLKANCVIPLIDFFILKESDFIPKSVIVEIKKLFNKNERKL